MASEDKTEPISEKKIESISEKKTETVTDRVIDKGTQKITEIITEKTSESGSEKRGKSELREKTELLDPLTAVRLVWAITDGFPKSRLLKKKEEADLKEAEPIQSEHRHYSNINADEANALLAKILTESEKNQQEKEYIAKTVVIMRAALRNLGTIYSGRELNFKENETLRDAYVEAIKESITFGKDFKDFAVGIPAAVVIALSSIGISLILNNWFGLELSSTDIYLIAIGFGLLGFLFYGFQIKYGNRDKFRGMIQQDLERKIYFEQYLFRTHGQLQELFKELNIVHQDVFKKPYPGEPESGKKAIEQLIKNLCPTACEFINECALKGGTHPDTWALCETRAGSSCLTRLEKPFEPPEKCLYWRRPAIPKAYIGLAILAVLIFGFALIAVFAPPGPVATLEKSPPLAELQVNGSLNISVALSNQGGDSITEISIKDEIPDGFNLTSGNTNLDKELLEKGSTIYMNYTLLALKEGTYDLQPATASYTVNGNSQKISSNSGKVNVTKGENTPPQGATNPTKNTTPS